MNFKFMTWYYDRGTAPRDFMFVLPARSRDGFYGWKYSCWADMPTTLNLAYSFANIESDEKWREKWKNQLGQRDPKLEPKQQKQMLKDLFQTVAKKGLWI